MANYNLYDINVIIPTFNSTINTEIINTALIKIKNTAGSCIILNLILTEDFKAQPISQTSSDTKYDITNTIFIKVLQDKKKIHILLTHDFFNKILLDTPNNITDPDIVSGIESSNNHTLPKNQPSSHILQQNNTDAHIYIPSGNVRRTGTPRGSKPLLPKKHSNNTSDTHTYNHPFSLS